MNVLRLAPHMFAGLALTVAVCAGADEGALPGAARQDARAASPAVTALDPAAGGVVASQRLRLGGRMMTVVEACAAGEATVTACTAFGAAAGAPCMVEVGALRFVAHTYTGSTVRIATWGGDELQVLPEQLLLTPFGDVVAARDVQVAATLLASEDGPVAVRQTWLSPYTGTIWQLQAVEAAGAAGGDDVPMVVAGGLVAVPPLPQR